MTKKINLLEWTKPGAFGPVSNGNDRTICLKLSIETQKKLGQQRKVS